MKIRKRIIVLAFLAVAFISAMAQKQQFDYTIYGVVEDSITHEGEPYATLSIYRKGHEEKAVQMAVTDANGKFKVAAKGEGDYVLEVKSVSRTPLRRFFTVSKQSRSQNLGTLLVSDSTTTILVNEVTSSSADGAIDSAVTARISSETTGSQAATSEMNSRTGMATGAEPVTTVKVLLLAGIIGCVAGLRLVGEPAH